jgi:PAS domain S-box-containing protein
MNEKFYKDIIDSLPYAFLVLDEKLRVVQCNHKGEVLFSKTKKEILASDLPELIPHEELRSQIKAVQKTSETKLVELHLDADKPKILKAIINPLSPTTQSEHASCLVTLEDISERARFEEQLVLSEKLAGMGLLASSVAHELGNPLTIMNSTLQYIRHTMLNAGDQQLKLAARRTGIIEAVETMMDSIKQMHELLRILSGFNGSQLPRFEPTDLRQILSQMLTFIHSEAETRGIRVHHEFDDDLPDCQVDLREVKQLFLNLLKNAMEAMPDGGELCIRVYPVVNKDAVRADISDTGTGIGEVELRSIFKPFYSTKPDGTGLGLSFCQRVMEKHGGKISIESKLHKGSTFSVIFPVYQGENI